MSSRWSCSQPPREVQLTAGGVGLPDLNEGLGDGATVLAGDAAVDDDALPDGLSPR